jgi:phage-related tail fiber protein
MEYNFDMEPFTYSSEMQAIKDTTRAVADTKISNPPLITDVNTNSTSTRPSRIAEDLRVIDRASQEVVEAYTNMESPGIIFDANSADTSTPRAGRIHQSGFNNQDILLDQAGYPAFLR